MSTYMLEMKDDSRKKITIPSTWKLTFGALVPGSKDGNLNGGGATCLRLYEGTQQKAVFVNVLSFRDTSINIEEESVKRQAETFYRKDEDGAERAVVVEGVVKEWVNPDTPRQRDDSMKLLPAGMAAQVGGKRQ